MQYSCSVCGDVHDSLPAIAFNAPYNYYELSEDKKETIVELSDDFCIIRYDDQTDRFIRAVMFQAIVDSDEYLEYGVWVSLSEKSFTDYKNNFYSEEHETTYFGFLCSQILPYENTLFIETNVVCSKGNNRPSIIPHRNQSDSNFVNDYYKGINRREAEKRIHFVIDNSDGNFSSQHKFPTQSSHHIQQLFPRDDCSS